MNIIFNNAGVTRMAVANAIFNAVGVRIRNLPITPEKIMQKLKGF